MGSGRLILLIGVGTIAGVVATKSIAQSVEVSASAPRDDRYWPANIDSAALRARATRGDLGLEPPFDANNGLAPPPGLGYRSDTKSISMPLDQKSNWSLGIGFNLNSSRTVELSPSSSVGLQPKPAPGFLLKKRF